MTTFRTRARAVDMLGRQQIAGIPTAISELFKNAHDAYAAQAVVDFYRSDNLFVLRDDGLGMTEQDFEERWLTLGTDSKVESRGSIASQDGRPGYPKRAILGEKGIGRLAIASIGPQTLLLSRAERAGELGDLLVAFINWGLFEFPSANLEDVDIPTVTVPGGNLPDRSEVGTLVDWAQENLERLGNDGDQLLRRRIAAELASFRTLDPSELERQLGEPSLVTGPGTQFLIRPASALISEELDERGRAATEAATPLRRMLVGFANTMTPAHLEPSVVTSFRDHYTEDAFQDVIGEGEFFTPEEFSSADHHIRGTFDNYGQFEGSVGVYGGEPEEYLVSWGPAAGRKTGCGPFRLDLAYVQGQLKDSRLPADDYATISSKLNRYGGLYIYRDGIRVLPYGNSDFDFLDIEVRRAKSASDAFFSYRRMFGVVELTRKRNSALSEKAGREGFSDNAAYRQFRNILKNFLYQVALDYFREAGSRSDRFRAERSELNRLDKARQSRSKQVRVRRREFSEALDGFFESVDAGVPEQQVQDLLDRLDGWISAASRPDDASATAQKLMAAERATREALRGIERAVSLARPRGVGLTKDQTRSWMAYENEHARLEAEVLNIADREINKRVGGAFAAANVDAEKRARFDAAIELVADKSRNSVRSARKELDGVSKKTTKGTRDVGRDLTARLDSLIEDVRSRAARTDVGKMSDARFLAARDKLERELAEETTECVEMMSRLTAELSQVDWTQNGKGMASSLLEQVEAMETDLEALLDQSERDMELAQLGAAIAVINHEFDDTITSMRRSLRRFKSWSDENPALREPYRDLRSSFEHLDGYLRMFTPLNRRLYRSKVEMTGAEIEKYMLDVFERRLRANQVSLTATDEFARARISQYPSVIYPVFVNLIDNAIFWLTDYRGARIVTLDAAGSALLVRDTGPGVMTRDRDAVFDFGYSRKPGGSGYGLYIARKALEGEGWTLELGKARADVGCEFIIRPGEGE